MITNNKGSRINIRLTQEERDEFHEVCKSKGTNISKAIRKFIKEQIKEAYR